MVGARHLAALAALALSVPLAVSCVKIIGADEERTSIAFELCKCPGNPLPFLKEDCTDTLERRLEGAREETRQKWMEKAIELRCTECMNVLECYRTSPTCSDDQCTETNECCEGLICADSGGDEKQCTPP